MGYIYYNPNPANKFVGDCVIRALTKITNKTWQEAYLDVVAEGLLDYDMPNADYVWGKCLFKKGFQKHILPDTCPYCYTVREFAKDHPHGSFIVKTSGHVVAVVDGDYYDTSDSGNEVPIYFWSKGEE